jgi:hypothetical protein
VQAQIETELLERGVGGTEKTIEKMHRLVEQAKLDPTIQRIATWIRLSVPQDARGKGKEIADAIFYWVKRHGVFQSDPFQVEQITSLLASAKPVMDARRAGAYRGPGIFQGDCDSFAMWVAALGGVLGLQYAFGTCKTDASRPDEFSHVWAELLVGGQWYALDPSTPSASPGWKPPVSEDRFRRWPEKPIEGVLGMGGLNGSARGNGLGYDPNSPEVPRDYFGYGQPRYYSEYDGKVGEIQNQVPYYTPGEMDLHVPRIPGTPAGEMKPGLKYTGKQPMKRPDQRDTLMEWYNYAPSPTYEPKRPYVHVSPGHSPQYPFANQVEVIPAEPLIVHRRAGERMTIMEEPEDVTQIGMGQQAAPGSVAGAGKAQVASTSIWDTIAKTITDTATAVIPGIAQAQILKMQAKYADKLATATTRATGVETTPQQFVAPAKEWYQQPLFWVVGSAAALGIGYAVIKGMRKGPVAIRRRGR